MDSPARDSSASHETPTSVPPAVKLEQRTLPLSNGELDPDVAGTQYAPLLCDWIAEELSGDAPSPLRLSLALGAVEAALTSPAPPQLSPSTLPVLVGSMAEAFQAWVADVLTPKLKASQSMREKVHASAAAVWAMLAAGSYSKDVLHAQVKKGRQHWCQRLGQYVLGVDVQPAHARMVVWFGLDA